MKLLYTAIVSVLSACTPVTDARFDYLQVVLMGGPFDGNIVFSPAKNSTGLGPVYGDQNTPFTNRIPNPRRRPE